MMAKKRRKVTKKNMKTKIIHNISLCNLYITPNIVIFAT